MSVRYDPARAQRIVGWLRPWHRFAAKPIDPEEPSIGSLAREAGEQLEAAQGVIDRLLALLPPEQRLAEMARMNRPKG